MKTSKVDLILSKIPEKDFKLVCKKIRKGLSEKFKTFIIKKIGKLFGTPTYYLFKFFLSGIYYSYVLPKRLIAKNRLKSLEFNKNIKEDIEKFEKSESLKKFIKLWKAENEKK